jgi:2-polyprenyl-3-methyl-5-hydroxy-6-metoxy-1,4-benzoquinol methylase
MDKKLEKVYLETQNHWKNTNDYSSSGYENFKLGRRKYLANRIVELKPKSVLEIGCFGGYNLREINNLDPDIELTGFDINSNALAYAKNKLPKINTVNGSIYELSKYFEENQFDIVFTAGVLIHIPCFTNKVETENIRDISANISRIANQFIFHAEHHGESHYKLPNKNMRYVHNFNELYSTSKNVEVENAPDASHGFEQIIKITL